MGGGKRALEDKARLEAFLSAVPGEYCGFLKGGQAIYSRNFCDLLGLDLIQGIQDIQNALHVADSAALEGVYNRLIQENIPFTIIVKSKDESKILKLSGSKGRALDDSDTMIVLWIENITVERQAQERFTQELNEKEKRLDTLNLALDSFAWPLWRRDTNLELAWCNKAYSKLVGTTPEIVEREQKEITPASRKKKKSADGDAPLLGKDLALKAVKSGRPQQNTMHVISGGKRLLLRIFENPVPGKNFTVGFAEDITQQEDLENELKRFQATNKELLGQLRSAIAIFNDDTSLEFYNTAFAQLWGLEEGWLNRHPKLGDIMEKLREHRKLPEQADFKRFKQGWLDMFTSLIEAKDDMLYLPDGSALRMLSVPQSSGGLMMTFEDVTSRLELESSINTLIAVQKETLDNLAEGVAVYGSNGRLKLWNPAFSGLWDLNPEDLERNPHISQIVDRKKGFFAKDDWAAKREELKSAGLERKSRVKRIKRADDSILDYATVPLPDGGVLMTFTDVSDTVRVENALREKNAALEAAEQLKIDFLANVSYQLRTPLNAIMGFNEILDQEYFGPLNERQKEYTGDIRSAGDRLINLVNDILDLSSIEAGYLTLDKEEVKVKDLLHGLHELVQGWSRNDQIEIILDCPANIGKIRMDGRRIKQALVNLIRNSIAYTPSGGTITLKARRKKAGIEITVTDTGIGIAAENQKRIFEPFEKAHRGQMDHSVQKDGEFKGRGGAGLGLSLVKNIATLHGGSIDLVSEPGKGTSVTLYIPFTDDQTGSHAIRMTEPLSFLGE